MVYILRLDRRFTLFGSNYWKREKMKESDIFKIASYSNKLLNTLNQNKRPLTDAEILGICNRLWNYYRPDHEIYICNSLLDRYYYDDQMYIRDLLCEYKAEFLNS